MGETGENLKPSDGAQLQEHRNLPDRQFVPQAILWGASKHVADLPSTSCLDSTHQPPCLLQGVRAGGGGPQILLHVANAEAHALALRPGLLQPVVLVGGVLNTKPSIGHHRRGSESERMLHQVPVRDEGHAPPDARASR